MGKRTDALSTPRSMIRWLEGFPPRKIVTRDMNEPRSCLLANYLIARGNQDVAVGGFDYDSDDRKNQPLPDWFFGVFHALPSKKPITAQQALRAIKENA